LWRQSWCQRIPSHFECQEIICLRLSCYSLLIRSICYFGVFGILHFRLPSALSTEQYQSVLIVELLCWPLNRMPCLIVLQCGDSLQELALSNRVQLVWVLGHCGIHRNEKADARVGLEPCGSGYLNHTAPHGAWRLLVVS
jgi:hypothetical protein